ncbi:MAG: AI-2E family transporter [Actinobacteria bacterium]|nr:MAG: AI-2E family transporter [Chloroflexota bacterium]TML14447.1 MAG: AI-2E family transporter [Actinomycetota bacterium]
MSGGTPTIQVPRWIQLVGLPILALIALLIVGKVFHAVFLFIVAALIALLLEPLVRSLERLRIPRGFSIAIVYLSFAAALAVVMIAVGVIVVDRTQSAANRIDTYLTSESGQPPQTGFERDVDRFQVWLDTHHLERIDVKKQGTDFAQSIKGKDVEKYTTDVIDFLRGAAISIFQLIFALVLILVVSIYMLLDMSRLKARVDRRFPPSPGKPGLIVQMEQAVAGYVRGQVLLSLIIGTSAGVGMWVLGMTGLVPGADKYAVVFGAWVAVMELIPYLGPWLGAIPPIIYALVVHPLSAVWVALLFLGIHQIEGHVVVPNVMGSALRLHPLLVIFGLIAGGELYGLPGLLVALPFLAVMRALWEFFGERVQFEPWQAGTVPVEVEVEETRPVKPVPPEEPPEAAAQRPVRSSGPGEGVSGEPGGSTGDDETAEIRRVNP